MSAPTEPPAGREAEHHHRAHVVIAAPPREVWALVADVTRHGEWSPVCTGCSWEGDAPSGDGSPVVGDRFVGRNSSDGRSWETRSVIVVAEPGTALAWQVNEDWVRWGFEVEPADPAGASSTLTETWEFLPAGLAGFRARDGGEAAISHRAQQARDGIPATLAAIKEIAEGGAG